MSLAGIRVLEMAGLAPAPMAGMMLSDFGAKVIRVDRTKQLMTVDRLARGKQSIAVDMKSADGLDIVKRLSMKSDVLIDSYRPGVMEKMGLGPKPLMTDNRALSTMKRFGGKPTPPINVLADFAGGGLLCTMGILMALIQRQQTGRGQVVDASMTEGAAYVSSWLWRSHDLQLAWPTKIPGRNLLDTGAPFYDTYETKDGKYMAVGSIEPQFYALLLKGLGLTEDQMPGTQLDIKKWPAMKDKLTEVFSEKTQSEWCQVFDGTDACVTPVLSLDEATQNPHNTAREAFVPSHSGKLEPRPAPLLSDTPAVHQSMPDPVIGQHTEEVLRDADFTENEIKRFIEKDVVEVSGK
uniref:Alpha-methylacyl-CoA racemase-like n=1 Tax=Saccoglossus kowalevskii TaxID=10224 RepID=A0ABM0MTQ8_SACKO|nr:PREDICTED: alpha-methylacyl-CoA racemase-like [Saccoglossus kowalevskii]